MRNKVNREKLLNLYRKLPFHHRLFVRLRADMLPLEEINEIIPNEGVIVDLGCGHGVISNYLALLSSQRNVYGIDFDDERISLARTTVGIRNNINFENKDITNLNIIESNAVILFGVLCLVPFESWGIILQKVKNSLSSDGVLLIHEIKKTDTFLYKIHAFKEHVFRAIGITKAKGLYVMNEGDFVEKMKSLDLECKKMGVNVKGHSTITYVLKKK